MEITNSPGSNTTSQIFPGENYYSHHLQTKLFGTFGTFTCAISDEYGRTDQKEFFYGRHRTIVELRRMTGKGVVTHVL